MPNCIQSLCNNRIELALLGNGWLDLARIVVKDGGARRTTEEGRDIVPRTSDQRGHLTSINIEGSGDLCGGINIILE